MFINNKDLVYLLKLPTLCSESTGRVPVPYGAGMLARKRLVSLGTKADLLICYVRYGTRNVQYLQYIGILDPTY
jgi:hypothetical protein